MKLSLQIFLVIILFLTSCVESRQEDKEKIILYEFFSAYISEKSKPNTNPEVIDSLKKNYCKDEYILFLDTAHFEADPFLDVQDYDKKWLESLTVYIEDPKLNVYKICFHISFNNEQKCVNVKLTNDGKISEVFSDK